MSLANQIAEAASSLPEQTQQEILDYVLSIKEGMQKQLEADMDAVIDENMEALKELAK